MDQVRLANKKGACQIARLHRKVYGLRLHGISNVLLQNDRK